MRILHQKKSVSNEVLTNERFASERLGSRGSNDVRSVQTVKLRIIEEHFVGFSISKRPPSLKDIHTTGRFDSEIHVYAQDRRI